MKMMMIGSGQGNGPLGRRIRTGTLVFGVEGPVRIKKYLVFAVSGDNVSVILCSDEGARAPLPFPPKVGGVISNLLPKLNAINIKGPFAKGELSEINYRDLLNDEIDTMADPRARGLLRNSNSAKVISTDTMEDDEERISSFRRIIVPTDRFSNVFVENLFTT